MKVIRELRSPILFFVASIVLSIHSTAAGASSENPDSQGFQTIGWTDLIPPDVLEILMNPPSYLSEIEDGSVEDQITGQIKSSIAAASDDAYQQALASTEVMAEMDGAKVRLPGFIVPLEFDDDLTVTQFYLVPYFGACLHMPPPPPNQIVLVDFPEGMPVMELYAPFWILGEMSTTLQESEMATAAYSMMMADFEPYSE